MKILIAGDIHGNGSHLRYLNRVAEEQEAEKIFQVGDFGYWEHMPEGVTFLNRANDFANMSNVDLYFLDGNHDKTSLLLEKYTERDKERFIVVRERVKYAPRGHRWTWDGMRFIALGGAYSIDKDYRLKLEKQGSGKPGRYWFPEEEMTDEDMAKILATPDEVEWWEHEMSIVEITRPVHVILAHDKPRASNPMWNRKTFPECLPNQDRLQMAVLALKPKLFVHGHLHYRYTDTIQCGDDAYTRVEGLDCDPEAAMYPSYNTKDSWIIIDTEELMNDQPGQDAEPHQ